MKSTIFFLILAVLFVLFIVIKSKMMSRSIGGFIKAGALVIDVRSRQEFEQGHFSTAVNIPVDQFEARLQEVGPNKERPVIVYCHAGTRAAVVSEILKKNGYLKIINARNRDALRKFDKK